MQACLVTEPGQCTVCQLDDPIRRDDQVHLRLERVGFCGTDLATYQGRNPLVSFPRVLGHELAARIEAVGAASGCTLPVGHPVTVLPYTTCGTCSACRVGRVNCCRNNQTLGVQRDGAMQGLLSVPAHNLIDGAGLDAAQRALVEPCAVGFHAVARAEVNEHDTVAVFGCGMIGLGAVVAAVIRGARVLAIDLAADKRAQAEALGAAIGIAGDGDVVQAIRDQTQGEGATVCIEAVGAATTYRAAIEAVAFAGRVACIGYAKQDVPITTSLVVQKELDVRGSRNALRADFDAVVAAFRAGAIDHAQLISRSVALSAAPQALAEWAAAPGSATRIHVCFGQ
ncbi:MAG: alcohol dehydrogenase catalytic domain-containing protein [Planctomycetota bacterium]|jgi:threonine dehydrogenase-like Zn-dependent dehydrogenase|nr:alcohol dehydrogenase catalytic domain-containing protein [Planctomycetota bacterium]